MERAMEQKNNAEVALRARLAAAQNKERAVDAFMEYKRGKYSHLLTFWALVSPVLKRHPGSLEFSHNIAALDHGRFEFRRDLEAPLLVPFSSKGLHLCTSLLFRVLCIAAFVHLFRVVLQPEVRVSSLILESGFQHVREPVFPDYFLHDSHVDAVLA
jgi:hypothetical protein